MFVDRLAEFQRGVNQKFEGVGNGVGQFLHDERGWVRRDWGKIGIIAEGSIALVLATAFHVVALPNALVFDAALVGSVAHMLTGEALMARHERIPFGTYMRRPLAGDETVSWGYLLTYPGSIPTGVVSLYVVVKLLGGS